MWLLPLALRYFTLLIVSDKIFQLFIIALVAGVFIILAGKLLNRAAMIIDSRSVGDIKKIFFSSGIGSGTVNIDGHNWLVEVADNNWSRAQGLSGRENLAKDRGMLFVFDEPGRHAFWMKGMNFSLDLIWINNGVVVDVTGNAPPLSLSSQNILYKPKEPANMVLEINAGEAARSGINIGDVVTITL